MGLGTAVCSVSIFTATVDRSHNRKTHKPSKIKNMAAQPGKQPGGTTSHAEDLSCPVESMQDDRSRELQRENALLKQQLKDSELKLRMYHCRLAAAQRNICNLTTQLEKVEEQNAKKAPTERDISVLSLQLQKAHEDLETCTAKLQKEDEQEKNEKVQAVKRGIVDLTLKLQKEQTALMKKAIKIVPCNTEETIQKIQSAQAEEVEKVNLQLQQLQTQLLQQALSLKPAPKEQKGPSKYQWHRTHRDQEQQMDQQQVTDKSQEKVPLGEIQQLKEKLAAKEALREQTERVALEMKVELHKKTFVLQEAQSKADQLKRDLLKTKDEAREEKQNYEAQLENLRQVNAQLAASQKKSQEQLQFHLEQWQEERAALQESAEELRQILGEKQQQWRKKESDMSSRLDTLESCIQEMLEKKAKKKNRWLVRLFGCSGS